MSVWAVQHIYRLGSTFCHMGFKGSLGTGLSFRPPCVHRRGSGTSTSRQSQEPCRRSRIARAARKRCRCGVLQWKRRCHASGGMDSDFAAQGHHIPAYVLSTLHYEHRQIGEHITVNAGLEIGGSKTVGCSIEVAVNIARNELEFIHRFRVPGYLAST